MAWSLYIRAAVFTLLAIMLSGCNSLIETYDTTFTSALANDNVSKLNSVSAYSTFAPNRAKSSRKVSKPYFIEFRARSAQTYGHATVVFGKLDRRGKVPVDKKGVLIPKMVQISGLHPATASNVPWSVGHVVPVPAETGPSDGDFEDIYVTARYRINLTKREFNKVVAIVHRQKAKNKLWYAPVFDMNCLGYINTIAKKMNLKVPRKILLPKDYVQSLKALNT
ncbi:MAG: hypothetical protein JKX93_06225 [Rhizobiaceae bacterium]|nr:hypothetical protein [Rhizobiaceae bacterium]